MIQAAATLLVVSLSAGSGGAQSVAGQLIRDTGIEGVVRAPDGTPLSGATVSVVGRGTETKTDADGRYALVVRGTYDRLVLIVVAELDQYRSSDITVQASREVVTANFTLIPAFASDVIVSAPIPMLNTADDVSRIQLAPAQIAVLPSLGERDIFRAFQLLPGVSGSNETSSGLFVRGGRPDQNLIEYDGFRIYHVDHLFGYFSAFNMDAIEKVDLSKGGFEARYGGTLSSVLEVRGKNGRLDKPGGSLGASLLSVHGLMETPLFSERATALVAVRRSFQGPLYNRILNLFDTGRGGRAPAAAAAPTGRFAASFASQPSSSFYDVNAKLLAKPSDADVVTLAIYRGNDSLDNSRRLEIPRALIDRLIARGIDPASRGIDINAPVLDITDVQDSGNTGVGLVWSRQWNGRVQSEVSFGYSRFNDERDRSSQIGSNNAPSAEINHLDDVTFKARVPITFSPGHTLETGINVTTSDFAYSFRNAPRTAPNAGPTMPSTLTNVLDRTGTGRLAALYVQDRWLLGSKLLVVPGIRFSTFDRTREHYVDPRMAATWFVNDRVKLKIASGRYHQFSSRITREDVLQGNRAFWSVADGSVLPVSEATHLIVGGSYQRGNFLIDIEAFDKDASGITQFAPRLATSSEGVNFQDYFYQGDETARGVELLVQKRAGRHTGWVSYTLSQVQDTFPTLESEPFPADHEQRHELKIVHVMGFGKWTLSATWIGASGKPYTEPVGFEPILLLGGRTVDRIVVGTKNGARLPTYHRLDVALNREIAIGSSGSKALFGVTLFNLYDRENIWYKEFNVVEGEVTENNIGLMGRTVNVFFGLKF